MLRIMTQALETLMTPSAWDLAWLSVLVAVALLALRRGDAEDAGDAD